MKKIVILPLIILMLSSVFSYKKQHAAAVEKEKTVRILVYPFKNTGSNEFSWIAEGMTDTVLSDFTRIRDIAVISEMDRKKAANEIALGQTGIVSEGTAVKVGEMTGANLIFTGSYYVNNNAIRVIAKLVRVSSGNVEKTFKVDGSLNELNKLNDSIVFGLMSETEKIQIADIKPVVFKEEDKKKIAQEWRPDPKAYEWYSKGLEKHDRYPREALQYYLKAVTIEKNYQDALTRIGWLYTTFNEFEKALKYLSKTKELLEEKNLQTTSKYAQILESIGNVYDFMGQYDQDLKYLYKAREIHDSLGRQNTSDYAYNHYKIGLAYSFKGQYDQSLDNLTKAKTGYEKLGLDKTTDYSNVMSFIGYIKRMKLLYDEALEYYFKTKTILDNLGLQNTRNYYNTLLYIGFCYEGKEQNDEALEYFFKSMDIIKKIGLENTGDYAGIVSGIGIAYYNKGKYDLALDYFFKADGNHKKFGRTNTTNNAFNLNWISYTYFEKMNDPCKGLPYAKSCAEILEGIGHSIAADKRAYYEKMKKACGR